MSSKGKHKASHRVKFEAEVKRRRMSEKSRYDYSRYRLSSAKSDIKQFYDVVVVGSGYGASIAASRSARAGKSVCVLEKGKEWLPGDFPENDVGALTEIQMGGQSGHFGKSTNLFDVVTGKDVTVLQGCGLGGGSLINANVGLECDMRVFEDKVWPESLRTDIRSMKTGDGETTSGTALDRQRVHSMLKPVPYPDEFPQLNKMVAMEEAAKNIAIPDVEDLGDVFRKAPLYVNFKDKSRNHVGIPQPACIGCGNCCGGCNTGAKNSLNMNYLPDAKAHGAEIYTKIEVKKLKRDHDRWTVYYVPAEQRDTWFDTKELFIHAETVILGAGSLGSTGILLRSKADGRIQLSSKLGERFTTNGDSLNFSYDGVLPINPAGVELENLNDSNRPGPSIVGLIDLRNRKGEEMKEGIVLQDGTPPCSSDTTYKLVVDWLEHGEHTTKEEQSELTEFSHRLSGKGFKNTLCFLSMSHDDASGKLVLDPNGGVLPEYPGIGEQKNFEKVRRAAKKATEGLKGKFIKNPYWGGLFASLRNKKGVITVHPLGGCGMGETGKDGVVNHAGQVFVGDSDEVYSGLYVVDGSIMPRSLGVNPTMTICILAERCMRLMAEQNSWTIDYDSRKMLKPLSKAPPKGIRFTEKMVGSLKLKNEKKSTPCEFLLTIESSDAKKMLNEDPDHSADVFGTVSCDAIASSPMTVSEGKFRFLNRSQSRVETREMVYELPIKNTEGEEFFFRGVKHVHKDSLLEIGLGDTTHLNVNMYRKKEVTDQNKNSEGILEFLGDGQLKIRLQDFIKQMLTLEVFNTDKITDKLKILSAFIWHFLRAMWHVYSPFQKVYKHDPETAVYSGRPLRLPDPQIQRLITPDQVEIEVRRFSGGKKGPILLVHGTGVSSRMFYIDTIEQNFVEFLVEKEYDVWTVDWRASFAMEASKLQWNIDQAARYDIPTAVGYILKTTGHKDLQVLVHCAGAISFYTSLLQGHLKGKIRSIISSQTGPCLVASKMNDWRSYLNAATFLKMIGIDGLSAYTDVNDSLFDKVINTIARLHAAVFTEVKEHCNNPVCHRISLTYHLLWNHSNLNKDTHDKLHEYFGYVNATVFEHFSKSVNKGHVVSSEGHDVYMPGLADKENRMTYESYRNQMKLLDIPTLFCSGQDNMCWDPETSMKSYEVCKEANPHQHYERSLMDGFGHFDNFIGKNSHKMVFPKFIQFLDKYALPISQTESSEGTGSTSQHRCLRSCGKHHQLS